MNATPAIDNDILTASLKYQIGRQSGMKDDLARRLNYTEKMLLVSVSCVWMNMPQLAENMLWEYALKNRYMKKVESKLLNKWTSIGTYTNKKGEDSQAHFTVHKHYLGSVKKLGEKPISYEGYFNINKEEWVIDLTKLREVQTLINKVENSINNIYNAAFWSSYDILSFFAPNPLLAPKEDGETVEVITEEEAREIVAAQAPAPEPKKEEEKPKPKRKAPTFIPKATPVKK